MLPPIQSALVDFLCLSASPCCCCVAREGGPGPTTEYKRMAALARVHTLRAFWIVCACAARLWHAAAAHFQALTGTAAVVAPQ